MSQLPPGCFAFDGKCKLSVDADITLQLSDGSLKAHSAILSMASPVFKTMFADCKETDTVVLERTVKETWIYILNVLHPAASPTSSTHMGNHPLLLDSVLDQAHKYGMEKLRNHVDAVAATGTFRRGGPPDVAGLRLILTRGLPASSEWIKGHFSDLLEERKRGAKNDGRARCLACGTVRQVSCNCQAQGAPSKAFSQSDSELRTFLKLAAGTANEATCRHILGKLIGFNLI